jgi:hypothetical protein
MPVRRSVVPSGWFALVLVLAGGCSSANKGNLTLQGDESQTLFAQSFNQAYISGSREGEYDLILLQDPAMAKQPEKGNKPLQPLNGGDLRQIVHVHVYWQASGGSVTKDGVVTNATIDWFVLGSPTTDRKEVLRYQGAGYVLLDEGKKVTKVVIRDGTIRMSEMSPAMRDPIGPAKLSGTIKATRNTEYVRGLLADLRAQTASETTPTVSQAR